MKWVAHAAATAAIVPRLICYRVAAAVIGPDRALQGATQSLAGIPGLRGDYLRRAFLCRVLRSCHPTATISYGTLFSKVDAVIEAHVYIGAACHLGLVHLEANVLLASGVHIPSGARTHGTDDVETPIREQPGRLMCVRIGAGTWVGSAAIVMADVGRDSVVAAGAVVTSPIPDHVIAGGVPARVIRTRTGSELSASAD